MTVVLSAPRLEIRLAGIRHNTATLAALCRVHNIALVGITKGSGGSPEIARAMLDGGAALLGDAQLLNLQRLRSAGIDVPLQLVRSPMLSQTSDVVQTANTSLNTDFHVMKQLSKMAAQDGKRHQVILMVEVGDNREGVFPQDAETIAKQVRALEGVELLGVGASIGCRHLVYGEAAQVRALLDVHRRLQDALKQTLPVVSLGGTVLLPLLLRGGMPGGITHLRIGEALLLGEDGVEQKPIPNTVQDAFRLVAEVIEVRAGQPAQALAAIGYQDVPGSELIPLMRGIQVVATTSDHLILNYDSAVKLRVGQEVGFLPTYHALVQICTSPYVAKHLIDE